MTGTTYGIVAGYDGSPGAAQALRWAAREAFARGTTLTVCLAWTPDHMELPTESDLCDLARQHGQEILTRGPGTPRTALLAAAADAQLLVVGARGRGGFDEMSLGSIAQAVLLYAPCPVAVVRPAA